MVQKPDHGDNESGLMAKDCSRNKIMDYYI